MLLNVEYTYAIPEVIFFLIFFFFLKELTFLLSVFFTSTFCSDFSTFLFIQIYFLRGVNFLPAIAMALPFLVLALHWVLCPLTGNFFLCLDPL